MHLADAATAWWVWPLALFVLTFFLGIVAVIAGVGGGVLFVPIVGSFFPFHLDYVRGAGLVLALTGTLAASPMLLRSGLANLRLVLPLALAGSICSLAGAVIGFALPVNVVQTSLGVIIIGVAVLLWVAKGGNMGDERTAPSFDWGSRRGVLGIASFGGIGFVGGLFGLGAGWANVPALNLLMGLPLKVAVGTSGLAISLINSSAAWVYIGRGALLPAVAMPSILGVMLGSRIGARLLHGMPSVMVRRIVITVLAIAGARALLRGLGIWP
ncbi:MAG TPA: sulfite exporter TauE/SafE family protein [Burkholderiales bacterium]|nr:sulfite exporter TauE/SafE family protein [Burkholderiales bacterium]